MARYQYTGPGPIETLSGGELVRPGDVREFGAEPDWGLWECIDSLPEPEPEPPAPAAPAPFTAPPAKTEGM